MKKNSISGFTLIEMLVVVVMTGVLASIAAPGWLAFVNRQRVNAVKDEMLQVLQKAQSDAQRGSVDYEVSIDSAVGSPNLTVKKSDATNGSQYPLSDEPIRQKMKLEATNPSLKFTSNGGVASDTKIPFVLKVSIDGISTPPRCIVVTTLLGGLVTGQGDDCTASAASYQPVPSP